MGSQGNEFQECVAIYTHEIGHALGLDHDTDNYNLDSMYTRHSLNGLWLRLTMR
ncbi:MAG: matrixin family metalloprotease [Nitrososphaerales archaeon]